MFSYLYIWPKVFPANSFTPAVALILTDSISKFEMFPLNIYFLMFIHHVTLLCWRNEPVFQTLLFISDLFWMKNRLFTNADVCKNAKPICERNQMCSDSLFRSIKPSLSSCTVRIRSAMAMETIRYDLRLKQKHTSSLLTNSSFLF